MYPVKPVYPVHPVNPVDPIKLIPLPQLKVPGPFEDQPTVPFGTNV